MSKSALRSEMSKVVDEGIRLATIALQFAKYDIDLETMEYTPFGVQGLENYALDALIAAAENLQYDGENDIAHRLKAGSSAQYIDPLCAYVRTLYPASHISAAFMALFNFQVAKRLRSYRLTIKAAALQTIPMVLKFGTLSDAGIQQLLDRRSFIYPHKASVRSRFLLLHV